MTRRPSMIATGFSVEIVLAFVGSLAVGLALPIVFCFDPAVLVDAIGVDWIACCSVWRAEGAHAKGGITNKQRRAAITYELG